MNRVAISIEGNNIGLEKFVASDSFIVLAMLLNHFYSKYRSSPYVMAARLNYSEGRYFLHDVVKESLSSDFFPKSLDANQFLANIQTEGIKTFRERFLNLLRTAYKASMHVEAEYFIGDVTLNELIVDLLYFRNFFPTPITNRTAFTEPRNSLLILARYFATVCQFNPNLGSLKLSTVMILLSINKADVTCCNKDSEC